MFKGKTVAIKPLSGGLTNISFIVTCAKQKYVPRFAPATYRSLGINKRAEAYNTATAAALGIGPRLFLYEPKLVITVLHKAHLSAPELRPEINVLSQNLSAIKRQLGELLPPVPCHFDLLPGNIILHGPQVQLIDWEYATNADCRFDLGNLSMMGGFSATQDKYFLDAYGETNSKNPEWLSLFKRLVHTRESVWAMHQWASPAKKPMSQTFYWRYAQRHCKQAIKL